MCVHDCLRTKVEAPPPPVEISVTVYIDVCDSSLVFLYMYVLMYTCIPSLSPYFVRQSL